MQALQLVSSILDEFIRRAGSVLNPGILAQTLKSIGLQIGRQAHAQCMLRASPQLRGNLGKDMQSLTKFSLWPCTLASAESEKIVLNITECPFGSCAVENSQYCHLTSGFFGGLTAPYFDKVKINVLPGNGCPRKDCRVHILTESAVSSPSCTGDIFTNTSDVATQIDLNGGSYLPFHPLTSREIKVLSLVGDGLTSREIAESLHSSVRTVENTIYRISSKLGIRGRSKLIRFALRHSIGEGHSQDVQPKKLSSPGKNGRNR